VHILPYPPLNYSIYIVSFILFLYVCAYVYLPHIYLYLINESLFLLMLVAGTRFFHSFLSLLLPSIPFILLMVPSYAHTHIIFIIAATTIQWIRTGKKEEFQTRVEPYAPYVIITYMYKRFFYIQKNSFYCLLNFFSFHNKKNFFWRNLQLKLMVLWLDGKVLEPCDVILVLFHP